MTGDDTAFNNLMPRIIRSLPMHSMLPPGGDPRNMRKTPKRSPQIQMLDANGGKTDSTLVAGCSRPWNSNRIRAARRAARRKKRGEIRLSLNVSVRLWFTVSRGKTQYVWAEGLTSSTSCGARASIAQRASPGERGEQRNVAARNAAISGLASWARVRRPRRRRWGRRRRSFRKCCLCCPRSGRIAAPRHLNR